MNMRPTDTLTFLNTAWCSRLLRSQAREKIMWFFEATSWGSLQLSIKHVFIIGCATCVQHIFVEFFAHLILNQNHSSNSWWLYSATEQVTCATVWRRLRTLPDKSVTNTTVWRRFATKFVIRHPCQAPGYSKGRSLSLSPSLTSLTIISTQWTITQSCLTCTLLRAAILRWGESAASGSREKERALFGTAQRLVRGNAFCGVKKTYPYAWQRHGPF